MKTEITISVPTSWGDITLEKWLGLQKDLVNYSDDEEAQGALMLHHLCNISADVIQKIPKVQFEKIKNQINSLPDPRKLPLTRFIKIDGVEYGLEPNLGDMTYACYADISQYESAGIDKNWGKIMSILYRPVKRKLNDLYEIEPYKAIINEEPWLKQSMDLHFGTMFFFLVTSMDLYKDILRFSKGLETHPNTKRILEKSGKLIAQFMNSQMVTYQDLMK
jgi:hypothetical protein